MDVTAVISVAQFVAGLPQHLPAALQRQTRHDFSSYKSSTLLRRIERRMAIHSIGSLPDYAAFLPDNPQEIDLLFKELLIGVTSFFREPAVWQHLSEVVLPDAVDDGAPGEWVFGVGDPAG